MSVRFVIGRAGAGKTHHCLAAVRDRLLSDPLDGPRLILLVPEQASLQTERALLGAAGLRIVHRAEVLSFRRLALRLAERSGADQPAALSTTGRTMLLRHLLGKLAPELRYFRNAERFPGFLERLGHTMDELICGDVDPADLDLQTEDAESDPLRRYKLGDLGCIYSAYVESLGTQRLDPSQYLAVAREHMNRCSWLPDAELWVDGFAGFTRQERLTLRDLARYVGRLEVTLLMDPRKARRDLRLFGEPLDVWAKPMRTRVELRRALEEVGVPLDEPLLLEGSPPRFHTAPQLAALERSIFQGPPTPAPDNQGEVQVFAAANRHVEIDRVVAEIVRLTQNPEDNLRLRDIGITLRDLQPYHDLLAAALEARGIPYFIDRRRPTTHHPLVEWLRGLVQLAVDGFAPGTAALLLKTGLLSVDRADAERVENHLIATELIGVSAWTRTWKPVLDRWSADDRPSRQRAIEQRHERLNQARQKVFDQLAPWVEFARDQEARSARTWAEGITAELERFGIHTQLEEWACSAEQDGDLDRAAEHRQIIRDVGELLEDLAGVLPDEPLTLGQLAQMLDSALAQFTLGLTPPTLDQVLVSGIERSRNPDLRVLFLLGFNDGAFPAAPAEDAILNDDDREWLESRGMELPPSSRTRLLEERLLAYVAFTRPSRKLVVSYAALDASGSQLSPSPYLEDLLAVCPQATQPFVDDPFRSRSDWSVRNPADLSAHLAHEFSARPPRELDDSPRRGFWNALYERVRIDPRIGDSVRRTLAALDYDNRAALSKSSVANAYHQLLHTSVSRLETFATCPFKHFAEWNLKLEPRRSVRLQPVDVGKIHHAVLELVVERVIHEQRSLVDLTEVELTTLLDQALGEVTESLPEASSAATARDRYILERSRSQLGRVLRAQQALAALGAFLPVAAELRFGFTDGGGLPPLEVDTPDGRQVCLRGIIDRVDLAGESPQTLGLVVDYKRTRDKRLDLCSVYHGLALQLLTYLLVLEQQGLDGQPVVPGGALYLSLLESYERVAHPDDAAPTPEATAGLFQPRGLLDLAHVGQVDRTFTETGRSENYQVALKKDGTLSRVDSSDAAGSADFRLLLGRVRQCIGRHADGILDGNVAVSPYRLGTFSPCSWCDLQAVCRFEFPTSTVRYLEKMKRSAVFAQLRG